MTFYHVLSAILFFGAFRELLRAIDSGDPDHFWMAAIVALFVFNDAIFTSWVIEQQHREYRPALMFIDLINFGILSAVLISLNSGEHNLFEVALPRIGSWVSEPRAWLLLGSYWGLIILWTKLAGVYDASDYPKWLIPLSVAIVLAFLIQAGFAEWSTSAVNGCVRLLVTVYTFIYILGVRAYALRRGLTPLKNS